MKKIKILCAVVFVAAIAVAIFAGYKQNDTRYPAVKRNALEFLLNNEDELRLLGDEVIERVKTNKKERSGTYKHKSVSHSIFTGLSDNMPKECVSFYIKDNVYYRYHGTKLIYCPTNDLIADEKPVIIRDDNSDANGTVTVFQKLKDNWFILCKYPDRLFDESEVN